MWRIGLKTIETKACSRFTKGHKARKADGVNNIDACPKSDTVPPPETACTDLSTRAESEESPVVVKDGVAVYFNRLRPSKKNIGKNSTGNRIVSLNCMTTAMNKFLSEHHSHSPTCQPVVELCPENEILQGLCVQESFRCSNCTFVLTNQPLFEYVEDSAGTRGPIPGKLNYQVAAALTKLPIGNSSLRLLLAGLDIPPPCKATLQQKANEVDELIKDINDQSMKLNQAKVRLVCQVRGKIDKGMALIDAETDVSYNNPPKGRAMSQPGTQAFCNLIESETPQKRVIAFNVASKLCPKCTQYRDKDGHCPGHPGLCTQTEPDIETKFSCIEEHLSEANFKDLSDIQVVHLCTDNDAKLLKGAKKVQPDTTKQDCSVHVSRNQIRQIHNTNLSDTFFGSISKKEKSGFLNKVGQAISKRCTAELNEGLRQCAGNDEQFYQTVSEAKDNILSCLSGDHTLCRKKSFICDGSEYSIKNSVSGLPNELPLSISEEDRQDLAKVIDYKLSMPMLERQHKGLTTNKSEATHKRLNRSLPKSNTWSRTFGGRAHSAILNASEGTGQSVINISKKMGTSLSETGQKLLKAIDREELYHARHRQSLRHKVLRKSRRTRKLAQKSGYKKCQLHPTVKELKEV